MSLDIDSPEQFDLAYVLFNGVPHPFQNPDVVVVDLIRIGCIIGGVLLVGVIINETRFLLKYATKHLPRVYGMCAIVAFALSAIFTEIGKLGDASTIRLIFNLAGIIFGTLYVRRLGYRLPGRKKYASDYDAENGEDK